MVLTWRVSMGKIELQQNKPQYERGSKVRNNRGSWTFRPQGKGVLTGFGNVDFSIFE